MVALFRAIQFANPADMDFRETDFEFLVILVVEFAVSQFAFGRQVRVPFLSVVAKVEKVGKH